VKGRIDVSRKRGSIHSITGRERKNVSKRNTRGAKIQPFSGKVFLEYHGEGKKKSEEGERARFRGGGILQTKSSAVPPRGRSPKPHIRKGEEM